MNYYGYDFIRESDLTHHGIKGQKWGQRRFQNEDGTWTAAGKERYGDDGSTGSRSLSGTAHRALAKVYSANEKAYAKLGNKTLASMNAAAKNQQLQKANAADQAKQQKQAEKAKREADRVDISKAKNSATRRVAEDYHNLSDREFKGKYQTNKKTFAKRYEKTKGDTYSLGLKKQARAIAFLNATQGKSLKRTAVDIATYTALSKAEQRQLDKGHEFAARVIKSGTESSLARKYHR